MKITKRQLKRIIREVNAGKPTIGRPADTFDNEWYEERHQADQDYRAYEVPDEVYIRVQNIKDPNRQDHLFDIVDAYEAGDRDFSMDVLLKNLEDAERVNEIKVRLKKTIKEAITTVSDQDFDRITVPGYKGSQPAPLKGYSDEAIAAAEHAVSVVGYPQGAMIENEIHNYLEAEYGMDSMGDEIWSVADQALSAAGILLGVGPDKL